MISSSSNSQVKHIIKLNHKTKERRREKVFVTEGYKMFNEAPKDWILDVYVTQKFEQQHREELLEHHYEVVSDPIFSLMSDTLTPQGVLCVIRMPFYSLDDILGKESPLCMILEDLQDPGNLGTIMRTSEGAGVTGIILSKNTVDLFNPKTIRATMGSIYRIPYLYVEDLCSILTELRDRKITTFAAHLDGKHTYDREDYTGGTAFFIGNEGNGLSQKLSKEAGRLIRIPMEGNVESLNAAVASSILMYEAYRQRRKSYLTKS
ncbi:RNA methyltransferase [Blautia liquoris]|uniref:RNA methyltransferase n=1 Tax=Blautia liquoris TaxID=2779518 RepID=A0A7M2RIY3_9FIRM|nr:RNA methyltransferase [Blautia liquoris]QOV19300.1 RNA methyltransferase [Blautia liquoris]